MPEETLTLDQQLDLVARDLISHTDTLKAWRGQFRRVGEILLEDRGSASSSTNWWDGGARGQLFFLQRLMAGYRAAGYGHAVRELTRVLNVSGYRLKGEEEPAEQTQTWTLLVRDPERFIALGHWFEQSRLDKDCNLDPSEPRPDYLKRILEAYPGLEERLRSLHRQDGLYFDVPKQISKLREEGHHGRWLNAPRGYPIYTVMISDKRPMWPDFPGYGMGIFMPCEPGDLIEQLKPEHQGGVSFWLFKVPKILLSRLNHVYFFPEAARDKWLRYRPSLVSRSVSDGYGAAIEPDNWWSDIDLGDRFSAYPVNLG